ncbi:MAG: translation elongation factor Ts [Mariprofundaceae bacterium]|nr:translation elongation factor Ts [Mariprofundaceae bacterium]
MAKITAADVKKLRELSGAGMMDCKKALTACDGDAEAAVDFLRKKGLGAASKKAGRVAAEGSVTAWINDCAGVLLEVNAETDFVSKNDQFNDFVARIGTIILTQNPVDVSALKALPFDAENTVGEALSQRIATIGENMNIRRFSFLKGDVLGTYIHGGGRIGVLVNIKGQACDALREVARGIAMHVAAINPLCISRDAMPADAIERERAVLSERALATGKPAKIIDKIVQGQLNKFYAESCLLEQAFVINTDLTVKEALKQAADDGQIVDVIRYELGEGIEKEVSDFAAEVAAQIQNA